MLSVLVFLQNRRIIRGIHVRNLLRLLRRRTALQPSQPFLQLIHNAPLQPEGIIHQDLVYSKRKNHKKTKTFAGGEDTFPAGCFCMFVLDESAGVGYNKENEAEQELDCKFELGDDWDTNNIRAIWMDQKENLGELQVFPKEVNGEELQFAKLELEHFSTYALIFREKET